MSEQQTPYLAELKKSAEKCGRQVVIIQDQAARIEELKQKLAERDWVSVTANPPNKEARLFYWVVPKLPEESPHDSSGNPIICKGQKPGRHEGVWGTWSNLEKPVYWQHLPPKPTGVNEYE